MKPILNIDLIHINTGAIITTIICENRNPNKKFGVYERGLIWKKEDKSIEWSILQRVLL